MTDDADEGWLDFPTKPGWWWHTISGWDRSDGITGWTEPRPVYVAEIVGGIAIGDSSVVVGRAPDPEWRERVRAATERDPFADVGTAHYRVGRAGKATVVRRPLMHHERWKRIDLPRVPWYPGRPE